MNEFSKEDKAPKRKSTSYAWYKIDPKRAKRNFNRENLKRGRDRVFVGDTDDVATFSGSGELDG